MDIHHAKDWLEFELLCLVKDYFSLEARIGRAKRRHQACRHLTHFQKMVRTMELAA